MLIPYVQKGFSVHSDFKLVVKFTRLGLSVHTIVFVNKHKRHKNVVFELRFLKLMVYTTV